MSTIQLTETVGSIAAKDYRKIEVFKNMGINFWCNGSKTIDEASREIGITAEDLIQALDKTPLSKQGPFPEFNKWNLESLIDHVVSTHHRYAKENAVLIYDLVQHVASHDGNNHPEVARLAPVIFLFFHDLLNHMKREEQILFPNIKQLIKKKSRPGKARYTTFGLIGESVRRMQKAHETIGKDLELFYELTNGYLLPEDACSSYRSLFEKLREFEDDLLLHFHLENNILFPKALAEDKELDENEFVYLNVKNNGYAKKAD
jgi:regulator of cell morphogenesis and NO signaling